MSAENISAENNHVTRNALLGLGFLLIVLAAAIFISAGTLRFWQGWLWLIVFGGWVIFISFYFLAKDPRLVERRTRVGPVAEQRTSQKVIQAFTGLCFVLILVIPGLDYRWGGASVPTWLVLVAEVLVFAGMALIYRVMQVNSFLASTIQVEGEQKVITTGPYAVVRHPMYSSALLMLFATPIALASWWGLLPAVGLAIGIVFRLLDEEQLLRVELAGYNEYCAQTTKRLLPGVW